MLVKLKQASLRNLYAFKEKRGLFRASDCRQRLKENELYSFLSHQLKIPYLGYFENDKSLISLFTEAQIRSQNILPLFKINKTLR